MSNSETRYFNLNITGVGYFNNARLVKPGEGARKFDPFWAVDVVAIHGAQEQTVKTRFDCRVVGKEAIELVRQYCDDINDRDKKVWASFRLGDLTPETFVYGARSKRQGETGVSLKSRLLKVSSLTIDGDKVHSATAEVKTMPETAEPRPETAEPEPEDDNTCPFDEQLSNSVSLSREDPDFEAKKDWLKANGYRWNRQDQTWVLQTAKSRPPTVNTRMAVCDR